MLVKCEKHDYFLDGEVWIRAEKFEVINLLKFF